MSDRLNPFRGYPHNPKVDKLVETLRKVPVGAYYKPTVEDKSRLSRARRILEKDGIVFKTVYMEGILRLAPNEVVSDDAARDRRLVKRRAKRSLTKLASVDDNALDARGKRARDFSIAVMGLISVSTDTKTLKQLGDAKQPKTIEQPELVAFLTKK